MKSSLVETCINLDNRMPIIACLHLLQTKQLEPTRSDDLWWCANSIIPYACLRALDSNPWILKLRNKANRLSLVRRIDSRSPFPRSCFIAHQLKRFLSYLLVNRLVDMGILSSSESFRSAH